MRKVKISLALFIIFALFFLAAAGFVEYYHLIFSRTVTGEVISVQRVDAPMAMISRQGEAPPAQVFSFAVAVEDPTNKEILVASSEDRRWATVEKGNCVTARFFPYPPWRLDKTGAYFGAQVITFMKSCDKKTE
jgi:hypothetical protein